MKLNYKILKNELIINLNESDSIENIKVMINNLLKRLNFKGNTITIFNNGIKIGYFILTNYYLKKYFILKNNYLDDINSYFNKMDYIELSF